jgi:hypothetical protein
MISVFVACQKFEPSCGDSWSSYIEWSGLRHIEEIVSSDIILCPSLIDTLMDEDWNFNVHADNRLHFFYDYEYLKRRIGYDSSRHNILSLTEHPTRILPPIDGFTFCGYDILDSDNLISLLLNCCTAPSLCAAHDLNQLGLIDDLDRATKIAETTRDKYPDDHHCRDCHVFGIARYDSHHITNTT